MELLLAYYLYLGIATVVVLVVLLVDWLKTKRGRAGFVGGIVGMIVFLVVGGILLGIAQELTKIFPKDGFIMLIGVLILSYVAALGSKDWVVKKLSPRDKETPIKRKGH